MAMHSTLINVGIGCDIALLTIVYIRNIITQGK